MTNHVHLLVTPHADYCVLARTDNQRRARYRKLFADNLGTRTVDEIRATTNGNYVIGNARFKEEIA